MNGVPHLGHLYTSVAVDTIHRFVSLFGESFFSIGTDEHGQKVEQSAQKNQCIVQDYVDRMAAEFYRLMTVADVKYDVFVRTTSQQHKENVLRFWEKFAQRTIYMKEIMLGGILRVTNNFIQMKK